MRKYRFFILSLIVVTYALATCTATIQVHSNIQTDARDRNYIVCSTRDCMDVALEILANLNRTVDPCDDFYQFACGGWVKNHPVIESYPETSTMLTISKKTKGQLADMLESAPKLGDTVALGKAKKLYAMCMKEPERGRVEVKRLFALIQRYGGWPMITPYRDNVTWQQISGIFMDTRFSNNVYRIEVLADEKKPDSHVIHILEPEPFISREKLLEIGQDPEKKEIYKSFIEDVAIVFIDNQGLYIDKKTIVKDALDVVEFEMALINRTMRDEDRDNVDRTYNAFTIEQFQQAYDAKQWTPKTEINWLSVLKGLFVALGLPLIGQTIDASEKIIVEAYDYLMQLIPLLQETPDRVIVNYMQWVMVRDMIAYSDPSLQQINAKIRKEFQQQMPNIPRFETCVNSPNLNAAILYAYSKRYAQRDKAKKIDDMIMDIKDVVRTGILNSTWMDGHTKNIPLYKLVYMKTQIGRPEWYSNEAIDEYYDELNITDGYLESIVNLKAFQVRKEFRKLRLRVDKNKWEDGIGSTMMGPSYNPIGNTLNIPAALLNNPMYYEKRPAYLNYGSMGFVIAHEIYHGFDSADRKFGDNINLWWTQRSIEKYENLTQCFVKQYNSYPAPGLDNIHKKGELSLGKNIADSAGVVAAYKSYKKWKNRLNLPDVRLPRLEEYTDEQLLFMSFANVFCSNAVPERLHSLYQSKHPLAETRIHGSLSNSYDFSAVYNCPVGKRMNPTNKCILWQ